MIDSGRVEHEIHTFGRREFVIEAHGHDETGYGIQILVRHWLIDDDGHLRGWGDRRMGDTEDERREIGLVGVEVYEPLPGDQEDGHGDGWCQVETVRRARVREGSRSKMEG